MRRFPDSALLWSAAALSAVCAAIYLLGARPITVDEIEYFRATDWIAHGLVPYRDFFEHHLPLQWFLFAPFAKLLSSPGTPAIIAMRVLQLPLWGITIAAIAVWARRDGRKPIVAAAALGSSMIFIMSAIEYRVDTVGACAIVLALVVGERRPVMRGVLASLAVLANIRFAPAAALVLILGLIVDLDQRRWRRPAWKPVLLMLAGGALPIAIGGAYLLATRSVSAFWASIVTQNATFDRLARLQPRSMMPLVSSLVRSLDIGTVLVVICAIVAGATSDWRRPGRVQIAAIMAAVNLLLVFKMAVQYFYHFEIVLLFCAFLAAYVDHRAVGFTVLAATLVTVFFTTRTSFAAIHVQDAVMREANGATEPTDSVLDGSGFATRRRPAYWYWFLPAGVRLAVAAGRAPRYTPQMLLDSPPGAVVIDLRLGACLADWPDVRRAVVRHYVPRWRNVWVPGASGVIGPGGTASVEIIRDGSYRLVAARGLLDHPWFHNAVASAYALGDTSIDLRRVPPAAVTTTAGDPNKPMQLRRGFHLEITSHGREPIGFFLVPAAAERLFEPPAGGGPLVDPLFDLR